LDGEALLGILGADRQRAAAYADEGLAHSLEHSLADYEQRARFIQGALLAQGGDPQHGIELMDTAIVAIERTNSLNRRTLYLGHYAAARASLGEPETGLDLLEQAVETAEKTNERFFEAELYRLRGKMLLTLGRTDAAEAALRRALKIAQEQQARWWELRTATTLAEHWHNEGKYAEAYALLQPVCGWFVEGLDTVDLQAAKALQDELSNLLGSQEGSGRVSHFGRARPHTFMLSVVCVSSKRTIRSRRRLDSNCVLKFFFAVPKGAVMAKHRKRGKTSQSSLPVSFSADIVRWQDGDTTKPDPLFILIVNNIALERPLDSNNFVADMSTGSKAEKKLFNKTAKYIKKNLFGEEPGQAEKLLADSPHSQKSSFGRCMFRGWR